MWGNFKFTGVVSRIGEELDYFASDGTALRAKVSLSLTEQDEKFEANETGPGSRDDTGSTPPGAEPAELRPWRAADVQSATRPRPPRRERACSSCSPGWAPIRRRGDRPWPG